MGGCGSKRRGRKGSHTPSHIGVCPTESKCCNSWRSCFHAVPSPDAPRHVSIPAMDTAWAPQLHSMSISLAKRRRGGGGEGVGGGHPGARPARAPLRPVVPASPPNPPFPAMALPCVLLCGYGRDAPGWERRTAGLGRGGRRQARDGPFCFQHKPGGAAPRPQNGSGCSPPAPAPRTRSCGKGRGRGRGGANGCIGSFVCKCLCISLNISDFPSNGQPRGRAPGTSEQSDHWLFFRKAAHERAQGTQCSGAVSSPAPGTPRLRGGLPLGARPAERPAARPECPPPHALPPPLPPPSCAR